MDPVKTVKVASTPISYSVLSNDGMLLGVGSSEGEVKHVSVSDLSVETDERLHEYVVKGLNFVGNTTTLVSGAPDYAYAFQPYSRKAGWFSTIAKIWLFLMLLFYLLKFAQEKFFK